MFEDLFGRQTEASLGPIPSDEVPRLLKAVEGRDKLIFLIGFNSGMWLDELVHLYWSNVDYNEQAVKVWTQGQKRMRPVYMPKDVFAYMKTYDTGDSAHTIFNISENQLRAKVVDYTKRLLGIPYDWHSIRLTYLYEARRHDMWIEDISENMGVPVDKLIKYHSRTHDELVQKLNGGFYR